VKFLRHLAAVLLVVAVFVGLGMLWRHVYPGGGRTDPGPPPPPAVVQQDDQHRLAAHYGLDLADTSNLINTCEIEVALASVVITVSVIRRWHRRTQRMAR
jgi:hypothetical protein